MSRNAAALRSAAAVLPLLGLAACGSPSVADPTVGSAAATAASAAAMTLTSTDVQQGATIARVHVYTANGCGGGNVSPTLSWSGAPAATRSFALTIHDPDAPHAGGFWHWVVFDLPAGTTGLPRGAGSAGSSGMPAGARQGRNDFGDSTYDGPCPPVGNAPHHYNFTLSALDVATLNLPAGSAAAQVDFAVRAHTLAAARLTGLYGR
jgi:hypothetical protein